MKEKIIKLLTSGNFEDVVIGCNLMISNDLVSEIFIESDANTPFRYKENRIIAFHYRWNGYFLNSYGNLFIITNCSPDSVIFSWDDGIYYYIK